MRSFLQYLGYLALRLVICIVQAIPLDVCQSGANVLGWLFHRLLRIRRRVVEDNLRQAYPELYDRQRDAIALGMWQHLFLFVAEVAHTSRLVHATNWKRRIAIDGGEALIRMLLEDRAMVLVSGHFGNFEICGYVMALFGYKMHAVARPLDNPYIDRWVGSFRASSGMTILSKLDDYQRMVDVLHNRGVIGFLADQSGGDKGCWVEFFGREASTHKAIALFSLHHDAPMVVGGCRRLGRPLEYEIAMQSVADPRSGQPEVAGVREMTQWYTTQLEQIVRSAPEQYWWLHRRWKGTRGEKKRRPQKSAA